MRSHSLPCACALFSHALPCQCSRACLTCAQATASAFVQPAASWVTRAAPVSAMPQMDFAASSMFAASSTFAESSTDVRLFSMCVYAASALLARASTHPVP